MRTFFRILSSELLKISKSKVWLLIVVSPILSTLVGILAEPYEGVDPWRIVLGTMVFLHGMLFLPILAGLFPAFICRYEHTGGGWKQLLVLPVSRSAVYLAKFTIVAGLLAVCQLLFLAGMLIAGWIQGFTDPIPWGIVATCLFGGWFACLPLAALQLGISLSWSSFAAPLAVNVSLTIPNMLIINSKDIAPFYPWAQPVLAMMPFGEADFGAFNLPLESLMVTVLGSFLVFFAAGLIHFRCKEI
ncbi:hypothetical protein FHR92_000351 [Fontibacillus solani]|uniref:Lantibiotic ABC transporter permease n=1 Tax=Fontibacillus solani TaxID=1572857 RepID=A0A7W3SPL9_9BACL|nr:ABC transporter permease [Fontibacillus solani]MBA9083908.1 hypothetical protein [Fontibacillus solani]